MTNIQPLTAVRLVSGIWLLLSPLIWLGAAVSEMDSDERYNIQLGVATVLVLVVIAAAIGAFNDRKWSRYVLLTLSWAAAGFWIYSGVSLSSKSNIEIVIICIGVGFVLLAVLLHLDRNFDVESKTEQLDS